MTIFFIIILFLLRNDCLQLEQSSEEYNQGCKRTDVKELFKNEKGLTTLRRELEYVLKTMKHDQTVDKDQILRELIRIFDDEIILKIFNNI